MKKSIFLAALCLMNVVLMAQDYELRVLTFEDEDAQFSEYTLDYAGATITTWSDLIDDPQYGGPLTYADYMSAAYHWYDEGNTELAHTFPDNYAYCFWGGGHAISNYWGEGWSDEDRDIHIAKYYGEDYVAENAGNDAMLGWFNLQMMVPVQAHSGENFAVHYGYKDFFTYIENLPELRFEDGEMHVIDHMYVTNTNYTLNQLYNGVKSEAGNSFGGNWEGLTDEAWLKIVAYGFDDVDADAYAEPISEVEFYLVQGKNVVTDWQKWDLSALGEVAKVRFNFLYSDEMGGKYGFTIPGYFAYDDVAVRFPKTTVEPIVVEYTETACDSYTWNGNTYTESGDYTVTLQTEQGRDSIENLHLTINQSATTEENIVTCDSYEWNGVVYSESGDYVFNTTTISGCDSVVTLHLTILPEALVENEELVLCPSELPYEWYGQSLTKAGSYTATEQYTGMECDSVIHELTLNVYVQTLPASVTLPIVRAGEAINVEVPTAEINAHIAADSWYAPNAVVAWYIQSNDTWSELTEEPVQAGISNIVLKYAVNSDCGSIESEVMNISVTTTAIENTQGNATQIYKMIHNGQLLIIRDGKIYNTMGQSLNHF
ncbi:MAG: DUF4465 domain-containing protein [Paludibacteraceae bacterium]|nr:DUF4465 domain-containing protein [Paludibacteraceae bacterium]